MNTYTQNELSKRRYTPSVYGYDLDFLPRGYNNTIMMFDEPPAVPAEPAPEATPEVPVEAPVETPAE